MQKSLTLALALALSGFAGAANAANEVKAADITPASPANDPPNRSRAKSNNVRCVTMAIRAVAQVKASINPVPAIGTQSNS